MLFPPQAAFTAGQILEVFMKYRLNFKKTEEGYSVWVSGQYRPLPVFAFD